MKKRIFKRVISLIAMVIVGGLMLIGCGSGNKESATNEEESVVGQQEVSVNVAALKGPTAMGMVKLMSDWDLGTTDMEKNKYNFTIAASPDEITPLLAKGEIDIAAVPANLASVLYNNTQGIVKVLAVNTLGVLYIVERGEAVTTVEDLRGKTIYVSGKGATPEYALNYILSSNGIDPKTEVTIEFKSEHSECVAALLADENAIAMLPQPFVTIAQENNEDIRIGLDLMEEWDEIQKSEEIPSTMITGVIVARAEFLEENPKAVETFLSQYEESVSYVNANTKEAATLIGEYEIVTAQVAEKALPYCNITFVAGEEMQEKLGGYLEVLFEQNIDSVGGKIPDEEFYYIKK